MIHIIYTSRSCQTPTVSKNPGMPSRIFQVGPIYSGILTLRPVHPAFWAVKWMPLLWPLLVDEVACPSSYLSCLEDCCPHSKQNQEMILSRSCEGLDRIVRGVKWEYLDYSNHETSMRVYFCFPAYDKITKHSMWQTTVSVVTTKQTHQCKMRIFSNDCQKHVQE